MRASFMLLSFAVVACAGNVQADDWSCYSTAGVSCQNMAVTVCPQGDFEQIRTGCGGTDDYIWIVARDASHNPIPGIPWTDYWIDACDAAHALCLCAEPIAADSLTGMNGRTTFSGIIRAGGCVLTGGVKMAIQGRFIQNPPNCLTPLCLSLVIKGPDITGASGKPDCVVDLSDLIPFGLSYNLDLGESGFSPCCDFNDDNKCNLSDFASFGQHYQHRCF